VVRRLILSSTVAFTVIGGSRPRGVGTHGGCFVGVGLGVGFLMVPFFTGTGRATVGAGGGGGTIDVTPAQVEGGVGEETKRSMSFSARNIWLKFKIWRPVDASSRTVGGPSIMVIRQRSSWVTTSSRNGAYPASWEMPSRICLQLWLRRCQRMHSGEVRCGLLFVGRDIYL